MLLNHWKPWSLLPMALWGCLAVVQPAAGQEPPIPPAPEPPAALANLKGKVNELIESVSTSEVEMDIIYHRSKLVRTKLDITRVAVADPTIVEVVAFGVREFELIGKELGSTTVTLWMGGEGREQRTLSLLVSVRADTSSTDRKRLEYTELQNMINEMFPESKIQLIPVADKLIVRGEARDAEEATRIMSILRRESGWGDVDMGFNTVGFDQGTAAQPFPDGGQMSDSRLINLIEVPGVHQVMLKVRIAELKRSAIRRIGGQFQLDLDDFFLTTLTGGAANVIASSTFDNAAFTVLLGALEANGSAKILAEPNLVTLSGHPATFLSGGEFAVPTVTGVGGVQGIQTYFKGFGTQLAFTPTVVDKDRIRLQVAPTFSTLNRNNSVNGIFGLDSRSVSTTVDLREGQVLALAGLIQEEQRGERSGLPLLQDIPLLGAVFGERSISRDETELVVLVTPELVHPMEPDEAPQLLPGMEVTEPDDCLFYVKGQIEGDPSCHHRSTVWPTYRSRMCRDSGRCVQYQRCEGYYVNGPHGFSR